MKWEYCMGIGMFCSSDLESRASCNGLEAVGVIRQGWVAGQGVTSSQIPACPGKSGSSGGRERAADTAGQGHE